MTARTHQCVIGGAGMYGTGVQAQCTPVPVYPSGTHPILNLYCLVMFGHAWVMVSLCLSGHGQSVSGQSWSVWVSLVMFGQSGSCLAWSGSCLAWFGLVWPGLV